MKRPLSGALNQLAPQTLLRLLSTSAPTGILELDTAGSALLCPSGHVFGLDTGYRYCPYDGAPLTMVDSTDPSG